MYRALSLARTLSRRYFRLPVPSPTFTTLSVTAGKSAAVTTAWTPSRASALLVSMDLMRACAWGLRRTLPCNRPEASKSAP